MVDFLYQEICTVVEGKRAPNYAPYIQAFINQAYTCSVMSAFLPAKHGRLQPHAKLDKYVDPNHPPPNGEAEASGSASACKRGKSATHTAYTSAPKSKRSFTYRAMKSIIGYVKAIHKCTFQASARSKKAVCMINEEHCKNGENIPAGSEDVHSVLKEFDAVFSSDDEVTQPAAQFHIVVHDEPEASGDFYGGSDV